MRAPRKARDWSIALALFGVTLALRLPFRTQYAYHWDSAQFALAVQHYDLTAGLPHLPGFFLYVKLGAWLNLLVGDPHASLVWLSMIAGALLPALGYRLGTAMFSRAAGWATGALLVTSPLCWFHSEIALTTGVDATLVVLTVLLCWRAMEDGRSGWLAVAASVSLAVVAGVRPYSAAMLAPAWLYAMVRARRLPTAVAVLVMASLFWAAPMVQSAGGLTGYGQLLRAKAQADQVATAWRGGWRVLMQNVHWIVIVCWTGLFAGAIVATPELLHWLWQEPRAARDEFYRRHRLQLQLLTMWCAPMILGWAILYFTMPGYALNFFPGLAVLCGAVLARVGRRRWGVLAVSAAVVLNAAVFLAPPRWTEHLLLGVPISAQELSDHDRRLDIAFRAVRARCPAADTVIFHANEFFFEGIRHFEYHLPEYRQVLLTPDPMLPGERGRRMWLTQHRHRSWIEHYKDIPRTVTVLCVPLGQDVRMFAPWFDVHNAAPMEGSGGMLYELTSPPQ